MSLTLVTPLNKTTPIPAGSVIEAVVQGRKTALVSDKEFPAQDVLAYFNMIFPSLNGKEIVQLLSGNYTVTI